MCALAITGESDWRESWRSLLVAVLLLLPGALWLWSLSVFDGLSSFQGDSGSYLLLARHWSPWWLPSPAEAASWPLQSYPPLFPGLLALTGASHSLALAHALVVSLAVAGAWAGIWYARDLLPLPWLGLLGALFLLAPGTLFATMPLMSETLYLLLSALVLLVCRRGPGSPLVLLLTGILLGLLLLTRSIGIALLLALLLVWPLRQALLVCALALLLQGGWLLFDPQQKLPGYTELLVELRPAQYLDVLRMNVAALTEGWHQFMAAPLQGAVWLMLSWVSLAVVLICLLRRAARWRSFSR